MSAASDTVTVDANGIHNTVFIDKLTLSPYNKRHHDETEQDSDT